MSASGGEVSIPEVSGVEYDEDGHGGEPEHETPKHITQLSDGGYACMYCGGQTHAHGGSVAPHPEMMGKGEESAEHEASESEQYEVREHERKNAFANAVSYARSKR